MDLEEKIKSVHGYLQNRNFLQAKETLSKLLKKIPNNSYLLNLSGMTHQYLDDHSSAIKYFTQAIKSDRKNIAAMNNLANSHKKLLNFFDAELIYKEILEIDANYVHALNNYANLKIEINNFNEAINLLKRAILIAPNKNIQSLDMMLTLSGAYQSLNDLTKVKKILDEIFAINPNFAPAHKLLSEITKY